jgi:putative endonuclease
MQSDLFPRYVYLLASTTQVLYTRITSDLHRRVFQHKAGLIPGFTRRYKATRLVYYERIAVFDLQSSANARPKAESDSRRFS